MSIDTLAPIIGYSLLGLIPLITGLTYLVSRAHEHELTLFLYFSRLTCAFAARLDLHHGRHRLEDHYDRQRSIRADFHRLTPKS